MADIPPYALLRLSVPLVGIVLGAALGSGDRRKTRWLMGLFFQ